MGDYQDEYEGFPRVIMAQREKYEPGSYQRDNSGESPNSALVIQHTEVGEAILKTREGVHKAAPGEAMLFAQGEDSNYSGGQSHYQLKFVTLAYSRGVYDLFQRIRSEFGPVVKMKPGGQAECLMCGVMEAFLGTTDPLLHAEDVYRFLIAILREQITRHQGSDPVAYGRFLLENHYRAPRNMSEWAEEIGISREHFSREFRRRYGESPTAYLRRKRLGHAQILMRTSPYSVTRIAMLSGFSNEQALRRARRLL